MKYILNILLFVIYRYLNPTISKEQAESILKMSGNDIKRLEKLNHDSEAYAKKILDIDTVDLNRARLVKNKYVTDANLKFACEISGKTVREELRATRAHLDRLGLSGADLDVIKKLYFKYQDYSPEERLLMLKLGGNADVVKAAIDCDNHTSLELISKVDNHTLYCLGEALNNYHEGLIHGADRMELHDICDLVLTKFSDMQMDWVYQEYHNAIDKLEMIFIYLIAAYDKTMDSLEEQMDEEKEKENNSKELGAETKTEDDNQEMMLIKHSDFTFARTSVAICEDGMGAFVYNVDLPYKFSKAKLIQIFKENGDGSVGDFVGFFRKGASEIDHLSYYSRKDVNDRVSLKAIIDEDGTITVNTEFLKRQFGKKSYDSRIYMVRSIEDDLYLGEFRIMEANKSIHDCILTPTKGSKDYTAAIVQNLQDDGYFVTEKVETDPVATYSVELVENASNMEILEDVTIEGDFRGSVFYIQEILDEFFDGRGFVMGALYVNGDRIGRFRFEDMGTYVTVRKIPDGEQLKMEIGCSSNCSDRPPTPVVPMKTVEKKEIKKVEIDPLIEIDC